MHKLVASRLEAGYKEPRHTVAAEVADKLDFDPSTRVALDLVLDVHHFHGSSCFDLDFELQMRNYIAL